MSQNSSTSNDSFKRMEEHWHDLSGAFDSLFNAPLPSLGHSNNESNHALDEYDLEYKGPIVDAAVRQKVEEARSQRSQYLNPLFSLMQMCALFEDEMVYCPVFMDYLKICLFGYGKSRTLTHSAVNSLRQNVRNATQESGRIVVDPPLPHPFNAKMMVGSFEVTKVMDATSRPKVIRFYSCDEEPEPLLPDVLHKIGDDLRQDLLILSSISIMNLNWGVSWEEMEEEEKRSVTDDAPQTQTYHVLPWGHKDGLIELVPNVTDQREWVDSISPEKYFASAAATVTACWVLGIGDRHRRNILATEDGAVFNIDFGYAFGKHAPMEGAEVPIPRSMYDHMNEQDYWELFVKLCLVVFDQLAAHDDLFSTCVESMAELIGYKKPSDESKTLKSFVMQKLSPKGRELFHKSILKAPFSMKSELKESIIPFWYMQVKRYHKHKEAGVNVIGHVAAEAEYYEKVVDNLNNYGDRMIQKWKKNPW